MKNLTCECIVGLVLVCAGSIASAQTDSGGLVQETSTSVFSADRFNQLEPDPHQQLFMTHYLTSNEPYHAVYVDTLPAVGGVFIGVATDQNFMAIPALKSDVAIFMYFDPNNLA